MWLASTCLARTASSQIKRMFQYRWAAEHALRSMLQEYRNRVAKKLKIGHPDACGAHVPVVANFGNQPNQASSSADLYLHCRGQKGHRSRQLTQLTLWCSSKVQSSLCSFIPGCCSLANQVFDLGRRPCCNCASSRTPFSWEHWQQVRDEPCYSWPTTFATARWTALCMRVSTQPPAAVSKPVSNPGSHVAMSGISAVLQKRLC